MTDFIHPLNGEPVSDAKFIPAIQARMALASKVGAGSWVTSVMLYTYPGGDIEMWAEEWDRYGCGLSSREWRGPRRLISVGEAAEIRSLAAALDAASPDGKPYRVLVEYSPRDTYAAAAARAKAAAAKRRAGRWKKIVAERDRLYDEEGMKWEQAVAFATRDRRLGDEALETLGGASADEVRMWQEAY